MWLQLRRVVLYLAAVGVGAERGARTNECKNRAQDEHAKPAKPTPRDAYRRAQQRAPRPPQATGVRIGAGVAVDAPAEPSARDRDRVRGARGPRGSSLSRRAPFRYGPWRLTLGRWPLASLASSLAARRATSDPTRRLSCREDRRCHYSPLRPIRTLRPALLTSARRGPSGSSE